MSDEHASRSTRLSQIVSEATALAAGESPASRVFLGGVVAGALVGAAVAGAALVRWRGGVSRETPVKSR
jgi:uncharacterized integral membrane protein